MCVNFLNVIDERAVAAALADGQGAVAAVIIVVRPLGVASRRHLLTRRSAEHRLAELGRGRLLLLLRHPVRPVSFLARLLVGVVDLDGWLLRDLIDRVARALLDKVLRLLLS